MSDFDFGGRPGMHVDVGRSHRTEAKLGILRRTIGREIGAAPYVARDWFKLYKNHLIIDLTAGDGSRFERRQWKHSCSPGIFCALGAPSRQFSRPHRIILIEKNPGVYDYLLANLAHELEFLGYSFQSEATWHHPKTGSVVEAMFGDARVVLPSIEPRPGEWLFINNDPNNMNGYALDTPVFAEWMSTGERFGSFMSTLGCNAGGLKRLPREERDVWFTHLRDAKQIILKHRRLDLLLFEVRNDASQWAYMLLVPAKWTPKTTREMVECCKRADIDVIPVSAIETSDAFDETCRRLFLTNKERES